MTRPDADLGGIRHVLTAVPPDSGEVYDRDPDPDPTTALSATVDGYPLGAGPGRHTHHEGETS